MVRVRKLVLAIAAASALSSGMAHALGLGEVTLQSALNQPLVAEIELLEVRDLTSSELRPSLASPEEFNKAGVDRQYFLTDLKFTPVLKPNGKSVIRVTSSKPLREPYLNFLVEVLWPNGRLLREYTLLLDPPLYSPQAVIPAAPQLPVAAPAPRPQVAAAPRPVQASGAPVAPAAPAAPRALGGSEYKTTANDTLWEIARRVPGGSVHQTMLAIQALNPDAFVGGNINRLKSGQVLRLPDAEQIKSRGQAEAIAQVAEQNAAWREGRSLAGGAARQLDATKRTVAGDAPAKAAAGDSLKLVAADTGKATAGTDTGTADSKTLADKLAVTQESLDSTRRENTELKDRMGDLQSQLDKLQRLIQLKDDQMAKLQADLAAQGQAPAVAPAVEAATPESAPEVGAEPERAQAPDSPVLARPAEPVVEPQQDFNYSEEPAPAAQPEAAAPQVSEPPAPAKPATAKPAAPVVAVAPPVETSPLDEFLANPMMLGIAGGGALLVLLLALIMLSRRNALKEAELQESLAADGQGVDLGTDTALPDDSFDTADDLAAEQDLAPAEERVAAQTGDALGEADIYIAYGRFNQAAELLQGAINDEPQRSDLRLKLMEVYAELGDRDGFARQDNELREIGGSASEVDQIKARYPAMLVVAGAAGFAATANAEDDDLSDFSFDDLALDEPTAPAVGGDLDDAFDLSLDDLEADLERDLQEAGKAASSSDMHGLSLDSDMDFSAPVEPKGKEGDELGFDLSLDEAAGESLAVEDDLADFSLDLDAPLELETAAEDEFLLSLDDEPSAAPVKSELPAAEEADNGFDLSADFDLALNDELPAQPSSDSFAAQLDEVNAELDQLAGDLEQSDALGMPASSDLSDTGMDGDDDFDFLSGTDETATKLDLARAYIDMGDTEGARDILDEVIAEGNDGQQQEARELIAKLV